MLVLRQTVPDMRNLNQLLLKQWQLNHHSPVLQLLVSICFLSTILKYFSPPHRRFGRSTTVYSILQIIWPADIYKADVVLFIWCLSTFCRCFNVSSAFLHLSCYIYSMKDKKFLTSIFAPFYSLFLIYDEFFWINLKKCFWFFYCTLWLHRFYPHLTVYSFIYLGRLYASLHINE